jgi:hypothetical protein
VLAKDEDTVGETRYAIRQVEPASGFSLFRVDRETGEVFVAGNDSSLFKSPEYEVCFATKFWHFATKISNFQCFKKALEFAGNAYWPQKAYLFHCKVGCLIRVVAPLAKFYLSDKTYFSSSFHCSPFCLRLGCFVMS